MKRVRTWLLVLIREAVKAEMAAHDAAVERELRSLDVGPRGGSYNPARAAHLRRINAWPQGGNEVIHFTTDHMSGGGSHGGTAGWL